MQSIWWLFIIIPFYNFYFESENFGEGGAELQTLEYLEKEKSFLHEVKNIYHFLRPFFWYNKEYSKKYTGHNL